MSAESRSDRTAGIVSPARWAATSSSVKNGLPWPRARISSTRSCGAVAPEQRRDPGGDVVVAETGQVDPVDCGEAGELGEAASLRRVRADLGRAVRADEHDGASRRFRARYSKRSQVLVSAQWRSSMPTATTPSTPRWPMQLEHRCEQAAGARPSPLGPLGRGRASARGRRGRPSRSGGPGWRGGSGGAGRASGASGMTSPPMGTQRPT